MNYTIIQNEDVLKSFINWLPDLKDQEAFYLTLLARGKYLKKLDIKLKIPGNDATLVRMTTTKETLLSKIRRMECPIGSYQVKGVIVPQESLAVYITINPRSLTTASQETWKTLQDRVFKQQFAHPGTIAYSAIQSAKSRSVFVTFDFDLDDKSKFYEIYFQVSQCINSEAVNWIETNGGYHLIVRTESIHSYYASTWYKEISNILATYSKDATNKGDIMLPVPGTIQGSFMPNTLVTSSSHGL